MKTNSLVQIAKLLQFPRNELAAMPNKTATIVRRRLKGLVSSKEMAITFHITTTLTGSPVPPHRNGFHEILMPDTPQLCQISSRNQIRFPLI